MKGQSFTEGDNFNVIVTDLFIDEQEIGGNNSSIQKLFESTFQKNKSIGSNKLDISPSQLKKARQQNLRSSARKNLGSLNH